MAGRLQEPRAFAALVFTAAVIATASGCGDDVPALDEPDPQPTADTLEQLRSAPFPVYWLGQSFRGRKLSSAELLPDRAIVRYGAPKCDAGCVYPVTVTSKAGIQDVLPAPRDRPELLPEVCFQRFRGTVVIGCDGLQWDVLTGRSDIAVDLEGRALRGKAALEALTPLNGKRSSDFPPAARIDCPAFRELPAWFKVKLPPSLPAENCPA